MRRLRLPSLVVLVAPFVLHAAACANAGDVSAPTESSGGAAAGSGGAGGEGGHGGAAGQGGTAGGGGEAVVGGGGSGGSGGSDPGPCGEQGGVVLAIDHVYFGDTNPDGSPNETNGWKQYGFDVDGLVSTAQSTDLCMPSSGGAAATVQPDGYFGIDNSFGKLILPIILGLNPAFSDAANATFTNGEFTLIFKLEDLGLEAEHDPLVAKVYGGAPLLAPPLWDGSTCWPVLQELLTDPSDIASSAVVFPTSSLADNKWSSVSTAKVTLSVPVFGTKLDLTIHHARVSMIVSPDHTTAGAGQIGGVLETEELVSEVRKVLGAFDPDWCAGSVYDSLANQARQASDIMKDGTQDPLATCDGISIGLGFKLTKVGLGGIAPPQPAGIDVCAGL